MVLLGLLIGGALLVALIVFAVFGGVMKVEGDQKKAENNAAQMLDGMFDGRSDVTFHAHLRTLKAETVILGAKERGYALTTQVGNPQAPTLIFEKNEAP